MRRFLFGSLLIFFTGSLTAQSDSLFIKKISDEIFRHSQAYTNLHELTKTIGGRLNGSPQTYLAENWGRNQLQKAGADSVYLQKTIIPHWVRGGKDKGAMIVGKTRQPIAVIALGNSVTTGPKGITAPMLLVHDWNELEQKKMEVKGKDCFFRSSL